jgi:hypothetical protein
LKGNDIMAMFSAAGQALNFGATGVASVGVGNSGGLGDQLNKQVADETDEEKLRRKLGFSVMQSGAAGMSPAARSLFGGLVG